jgi:hypothetical protein
VYMYMCSIPNGFRGRVISVYGSKFVDKREILHTDSNTGIYCSSDKVGRVYLVNTFSKIPPSTSMHFATRVRTWRVARLYSVLYSEVALSRKPFGIGHMYMYTILLRMIDNMTSVSSWGNLYIRTVLSVLHRSDLLLFTEI